MQKVDAVAVRKVIEQNVEQGTVICTDGALADQGLKGYAHDSVSYVKGEYVQGSVSTNGIESVWAFLKRIYMGTHHWASERHLHRYCNKICGRLNTGHDTLKRTIPPS